MHQIKNILQPKRYEKQRCVAQRQQQQAVGFRTGGPARSDRFGWRIAKNLERRTRDPILGAEHSSPSLYLAAPSGKIALTT